MSRKRSPRTSASVDLRTDVGSVQLRNPVMTASGTAGYGTELSGFVDLDEVGAIVVKSLGAEPWPGNAAPRVHATDSGMLNSVGLQGPGVAAWRREQLPALVSAGATVVASIWGRSVEDYADAAAALSDLPSAVVAVEVNLSCPNLDGGAHLFAHDPDAAAAVVAACAAAGVPRWAKLSPNTDRLVDVARAVGEAGAEAVTLVNTLLGMVIDVEHRRPVLGAGGGGLSGPAIRPVAVRAVHTVRAALPDLPIIGVGGITTGAHAVEFLLAGASAVQVGTATFADPRATAHVLGGLASWCEQHGVGSVRELIGGVHG
ncbi:MAG: dihydroorotate dehydrogenase [Actinomycetota bacterium]